MAITDYSTTPSSNAAISGINIAEGCNASNINNAIRQLMADLASAVANGILALPGDIKPTAKSAAPTGWLVTDGSAVSRTTYAALFSAIGTVYGNGDGSTTFNVPDLRGRTLVGVGTGSGLTARALAALGGEETHLLTSAETPATSVSGTTAAGSPHVHAIYDPGHAHSVITAVFNSAGGATVALDNQSLSSTSTLNTNTVSTGITMGSESAHTHSFSGTSAGGGGVHNNMQPFVAITYIIKT